jgi:hypothetical protein
VVKLVILLENAGCVVLAAVAVAEEVDVAVAALGIAEALVMAEGVLVPVADHLGVVVFHPVLEAIAGHHCHIVDARKFRIQMETG